MSDSSALQEFLAHRAKPYDPASDDYDRPPFPADIKEGKNDPIYNAHSYHTKVPPRSIIPNILHYTRPGDLILDPFCGSGMTGVAAQMCIHPPADILDQYPEMKDYIGPRACILNDLSPAACHIAYNYNTPVEIHALRREFERIKEAHKDKFAWLYGTEHYEPAVGVYDLTQPEVAGRLKNPPTAIEQTKLLDATERTWELLSRGEVEKRLGYPVAELPRDDAWGKLDLAVVEKWVCIPASVQYTIWSDVYRCEGFISIEEPTGRISTRGKNAGKPIMTTKRVSRGCGGEIVLWEAAVDPSTREIRDTFECPHCQQPWKKKQITRLCDRPVHTVFAFDGVASRSRFVRKRKGHRHTAKEAKHLAAVAAKKPDDFYPSGNIDIGREMMRHGLFARGLKFEQDFYSARQLHGLSLVWREIIATEDARLRRALQFAFTGIVHRCSRLNRLRPSGAGDPLTGTLYLGSLWRENHVLEDFLERREVWDGLATKVCLDTGIVLQGSAANLSGIPNESVDYIFTDPPFGSNIFYADCSMLWEAWLGAYTDEAQEMVVNDRRVGGPFKKLDEYEALMTLAFREMFRVLKPGRWATIEFNNSDGRVFDAIKRAVEGSGFNIVNMLLLDKAQKSFKQTKAASGNEDVVDKDVLFNIHKPAVSGPTKSAKDHDLEQQLTDIIGEYLRGLPDRIKAEPAKYSEEHRTTATINSILMNTLIPRRVSVERLSLPFIERVCSRYFRKLGQHWYLRGEAIGSAGHGGLIEEERDIKDELSAIAWLRQKLQTGPKLAGELKPLWMRAIGLLSAEMSQTLVLEDVLSENFWRDAETNRWREPTPEERDKMNDDRSLRVLHDAERFVNGTLRRPTADAERAEWIDALFQACRAVEDEAEALPSLRGFDPVEAYGLITRLFQGILRDHVTSDAWRKVEKQAGAASRKIAFRANEQKLKAIKARGSEGEQEHFDFGKG
jgi:DNA modification methylase